MNNANYRIVMVLIVLVLAIGFSIYKLQANKVTPSVALTPTEEVKVATTGVLDTLNKNLTDDEKFLLNTGTSALTKEEGQARFDLATKLAVEGKEINITDCVAKPIVLKVKNGSTITIFNGGSKDLPFGFDKEKVQIPTGKSISYKVDFKLGQGLYGYGCDNQDVPRAIGSILVTP